MPPEFVLPHPVAAPSPRESAAAAPTPIRLVGWLPWLCVILPLFAFAVVGLYRYQMLRAETEVRLDRALRIATEHALKVLDSTDVLLGRVQDVVTGPIDRIAREESSLHRQLRAMAQNKPQLHDIQIIGQDGLPRVSSRFQPAPAVDVSGSDYFQWHRQSGVGTHVSQPLFAQPGGDQFFFVSVSRRQGDGAFGGVVAVALMTDTFRKFHSDLAADEPGLAITMLRDDGLVFSRWPHLARAPARLAANSPVMSRIRAGSIEGTAHGVSSLDGRERLLTFRKVGDYPIYLGTGMDTAEIRNRWLGEMGWLAAFGVPPFIALFLAVRFALRRSGEALSAAHKLREASDARARVEEALLQSQKLEAMGRLTGGVAHDFNNLLAVVGNNAFLLERAADNAAVRTSSVAAIRRAVASGTQLTRQLLAFSRRQALHPEVLSLQEQLPGLLELVKPLLGSAVQLSLQVADDTAPICVDAAELELALLNLAANARDAMPGGGRLSVSAGNAARGGENPLEAAAVFIAVADTGSGIEAALLERAFEPFFTTKPVGQGTGLGLSQVYGFCQRSGGTARIESRVGVGTTVRLWFEPSAQVETHARSSNAAAFSSKLDCRVLLVEDNDAVAEALQPTLEAVGCVVRRVSTGDHALRALGDPGTSDLVLSDIVMPGSVDGLALAETLRRTHPQIPVILMTGYSARVDHAEQCGFAVLPKPCPPELLVAAIEKALRLKAIGS